MTRPVQACIGLGGNVGDVAVSLHSALALLQATPGITSVRSSGFYRTPAWGNAQQPDFINACAVMEVTLPPLTLLDRLQQIEQQLGRVRPAGGHWGPRTMDLDLLLYGDQCIDLPGLQVPHRWMHARAFVLLPLAELVGNALIPGQGRVLELLSALETGEVVPIGG